MDFEEELGTKSCGYMYISWQEKIVYRGNMMWVDRTESYTHLSYIIFLTNPRKDLELGGTPCALDAGRERNWLRETSSVLRNRKRTNYTPHHYTDSPSKFLPADVPMVLPLFYLLPQTRGISTMYTLYPSAGRRIARKKLNQKAPLQHSSQAWACDMSHSKNKYVELDK